MRMPYHGSYTYPEYYFFRRLSLRLSSVQGSVPSARSKANVRRSAWQGQAQGAAGGMHVTERTWSRRSLSLGLSLSSLTIELCDLP